MLLLFSLSRFRKSRPFGFTVRFFRDFSPVTLCPFFLLFSLEGRKWDLIVFIPGPLLFRFVTTHQERGVHFAIRWWCCTTTVTFSSSYYFPFDVVGGMWNLNGNIENTMSIIHVYIHDSNTVEH